MIMIIIIIIMISMIIVISAVPLAKKDAHNYNNA